MFQPNVWHRPSPNFVRVRTEACKLAKAPVSVADIEACSSQPDSTLSRSEEHPQDGQDTHPTDCNESCPASQPTAASINSTATTPRVLRLPTLIRKHNSELGHRKRKMTIGAVVNAAVAAEREASTSFESQDQLDLPESDVLEVYFCGSHSDVGGGSVTNTTQRSVSQIPLRWMVRQVKLADCGIIFDKHAMRRLKVPTDHPHSPKHASAWEKELDLADIQAPLHDQLDRVGSRLPSAWWLAEFVPSLFRWQTEDGDWRKEWKLNVGHGRQIRQPSSLPLFFHFTVRERMRDGYRPQAVWDADIEPQYVE
jgi:hypothetical protein